MNVLLVDDDRYIIQALTEKIDWSNLKVKNVYSACNIQQAQEVIQNNSIDLLISDIEMPQGSGLQLLAWIRQNNYDIQAIFLTNYADFNYAQKAIELQSFEYYLKPIEFDKLQLIIKKVLQRIQQTSSQVQSASLIEEYFWFEFLRKPQFDRQEQLLNEATNKKISLDKSECFLPIIITLDLFEDELDLKVNSGRIQLKQYLEEITSTYQYMSLVTIFKLENCFDRYLCLLKIDITKYSKEILSKIHNEIRSLFQRNVQIVIGEFSNFNNILQNTAHIYQFISDFCGRHDYMFFAEESKEKFPEYKHVALDFQTLFLDSNISTLEKTLENELIVYECNKLIPVDVLKSLRIDFMQKVISYLDQKQILAHKLFQSSEHDFLYQRSHNSIESFIKYMCYYIRTSVDYIELIDSQQSITQILIDYIDKHYADNLNRTTLSELVFLSSDYLAKLFKKETGKTLTNYITEKRIDVSKELLANTDIPIYLVASQVGYDNYSYFSRIFKKTTGVSPNDFRNKSGKKI